MRLCGLFCFLVCLAVGRPVFAADAAAEALFRAGREAMEQGDYATACGRFEESQRLEPAGGTAFNLAACFEKLGRVASAWKRYREAVERLPPGDERARVSEAQARALESKLPKLTLVLEQGAPNVAVELNGTALGAAGLGLPLPVDPGEQKIVVRAPGHQPRTLTVRLATSETKEVLLSPGPVSVSGPADAVAPSEVALATSSPPSVSGSGQRTLGWAVGGLGVAGLAVSMVTGVLVLDKKNTVDNECTSESCSSAGADAAQSGQTLSTVSTVAFAIGAVGVGVGAYLLLSAPDAPVTARVGMRSRSAFPELVLEGSFQ